MTTADVIAPPAHDLAQQVIDRIGIPKDEWEIAAQLEVMGLRDSDARSEYGARDLFDLAARIYAGFQDGRYRWSVETEDAAKASPVSRFLKNYFTGLTFSLLPVQSGTSCASSPDW